MATLRSIVTEYINLLDKPFDIALYNRVKQLVLSQRSLELAKLADRKGVDETLVQYVEIEVEPVEGNLGLRLSPNDRIVISKNPILKSRLDLTKECPFHYVGSEDLSNPYMYIHSRSSIERMRNNRYLSRTPLYFIQNSKLLCVSNNGLASVSVGHVWYDPGKIDRINGDLGVEYYNDDYEFLVSKSLLQVIKEKLIKGELGVLLSDDKTVKVESDEQGQNGGA